MKRHSDFRANTGLLGAFFLISLTGLLPAGVLYWLMRPTVIVNPEAGVTFNGRTLRSFRLLRQAVWSARQGRAT
jgi:hypothetical protein